MRRPAVQIVAWVLAVSAWAGAAPAQAPTELFRCLGFQDSPTCTDIWGPIVITQCPRRFEQFYGRVAWYPVRYAGPITVSVETFGNWTTRFPLYVEIVKLSNELGVCDNAPGNVVMVARGGQSPCGTWETVGPLDLSSVLPLGASYALRLRFFGSPGGDSPAVGCVRITSQPAALGLATWGAMKGLYR